MSRSRACMWYSRRGFVRLGPYLRISQNGQVPSDSIVLPFGVSAVTRVLLICINHFGVTHECSPRIGLRRYFRWSSFHSLEQTTFHFYRPARKMIVHGLNVGDYCLITTYQQARSHFAPFGSRPASAHSTRGREFYRFPINFGSLLLKI